MKGQGVAALLAARAVQGAGAAVVMPLALALLNAAFAPQRRGWAMGGKPSSAATAAGDSAADGASWVGRS